MQVLVCTMNGKGITAHMPRQALRRRRASPAYYSFFYVYMFVCTILAICQTFLKRFVWAENTSRTHRKIYLSLLLDQWILLRNSELKKVLQRSPKSMLHFCHVERFNVQVLFYGSHMHRKIKIESVKVLQYRLAGSGN